MQRSPKGRFSGPSVQTFEISGAHGEQIQAAETDPSFQYELSDHQNSGDVLAANQILANLALVSFSRFNNKLDGQVLVFFIITVAAAEVAVGLALIVALYRKRQSAHVEDLTSMKL